MALPSMLSDQTGYDGAFEAQGAYGNYAMQVTYVNHLQQWFLYIAGLLFGCLLMWLTFRLIANKILGLFV